MLSLEIRTWPVPWRVGQVARSHTGELKCLCVFTLRNLATWPLRHTGKTWPGPSTGENTRRIPKLAIWRSTSSASTATPWNYTRITPRQLAPGFIDRFAGGVVLQTTVDDRLEPLDVEKRAEGPGARFGFLLSFAPVSTRARIFPETFHGPSLDPGSFSGDFPDSLSQ